MFNPTRQIVANRNKAFGLVLEEKLVLKKSEKDKGLKIHQIAHVEKKKEEVLGKESGEADEIEEGLISDAEAF